MWQMEFSEQFSCGAGRFSDFWDEIKAYHGMQQTSDIAVSTGWKSVDEFYRVSCWAVRSELPSPYSFSSCPAQSITAHSCRRS